MGAETSGNDAEYREIKAMNDTQLLQELAFALGSTREVAVKVIQRLEQDAACSGNEDLAESWRKLWACKRALTKHQQER